MQSKNVLTNRIFKILFILIIWYGAGIAAVSFSRGAMVNGIIELAISVIPIFIMIDGRLVRKLGNRPIRKFILVPFYAIVFVSLYGIIQDWRFTDIRLLGKVYIPGVLSTVRSIGIAIITVILLWELIALTRQLLSSDQ